MRPRTLSASSLQVADTCLARYKAENIEYTPSDDSDKVAANIGTACHGALEQYVKAVYMDKSMEPGFELLIAFYTASYLETFDVVEYNTPEYKDGFAMLKTWFERTDLSTVTVVSVETKTRFPVPTSIGDIPLTYICDRIDTWEENGRIIVRVVDYKTIRAYLSPEEVRRKLQARIYDLMMRVQFKGQRVDEFQVVFDLLRHDQVGVIFSAEEAAECWNGIKARAERIIATPDANPPETLNPDCPYCVRKLQCKTLAKNIAGGGVFSIADIQEAAAKREQMAAQAKGLEMALKELDKYILAYAQQNETLGFVTDDGGYKVTISARKTRSVDAARAADILGPDLMKRYGKLNVGDIDSLMSDGTITAEQATQLRATISTSVGAPTVKVVKK